VCHKKPFCFLEPLAEAAAPLLKSTINSFARKIKQPMTWKSPPSLAGLAVGKVIIA
jgi:hypothetical protein